MKRYSQIWRTGVLFLTMLLITTGLTTRLVSIQLLTPLPEEVRSQTATRTYSVLAARGEILDREGRPLVVNALGFSVELDYYNWDKAEQNSVILRLCALLSEDGAEHTDNLPITLSPPYGYTFESWESPEAAKLAKLIGEQQGWPARPSAPELFALLCDKYGVERELLLQDKRTVVGVRYTMDLVPFSAYNTPMTLAPAIDIATVARLSERSLELPGVTIQEVGIRRQETPWAAHVLGRVGAIWPAEYEVLKEAPVPYKMTDVLGKEGMEKALEGYLRGINGVREVEVSKQTGEIVRESDIQPPDPGDTCYLTLDLELQAVAEQALALGLEQVRQKGEASKDGKGADVEGGAALVLEVKTGQVLAMASYPTFDLSRYSADFAANNSNPLKPFVNRACLGAYPPGSTFKMATAVAALESGATTPTEKIRDKGVYDFSADHHPACGIWNQRRETHGNINISQALAYSCNYFFYETAHRMGIETLRKYASALGLGQKTGIELPGENPGVLDGPEVRLPDKNPWHPGDITSVAIGQGANQFSPLQLANYMATILRGGTRLEAHLLKEVVDYTGSRVVYRQEPVVQDESPLKESTVKAIKEGMKGVVTDDGTASSYFRAFPMTVGGKTGSAQQPGGRSAHGVFISFAPYDDPEIVVVVIGEYAGTGGGMAPVCIEIYNQYFGLSVDVGLITRAPEPGTGPGTGPGTAETAVPRPQPTRPTVTEPPSDGQEATQPAVTQPAATRPAATQPAATRPTATEPAATRPTTTQPATTEPAATQPATEPATEPAATEPATEPAATEPGSGG